MPLNGSQYIDALRTLKASDVADLWLCDCAKKDPKRPARPGMFLHWSFNNRKLVKDGIISFNLPAYRDSEGNTVCGHAAECASYCYARQGYYIIPIVRQTREHNLRFLRRNTLAQFVACAVRDLQGLHPRWKMVRIHDSGDFLYPIAQDYFLAWCAIARQCPHLEFYGYTKMISMLNAHRDSMPANMHMVQSYGGKEDAFIDKAYAHSWVFATDEVRAAHGYVNGTKSDAPAYTRETKIGLVYHGTQKLNARQHKLMGKKLAHLVGK